MLSDCAVCGGADGSQPTIAYGSWSGTLTKHPIYNIYWPYNETETEGMFLQGDYVLISIAYHDGSTNPNKIYSVAKADVN